MIDAPLVVLIVALVGLLGGAPAGTSASGSNGNGSGTTTKHVQQVIRMRPGIVPFPQGVDDLQIFPYGNFIVVTGSRFISIEPDDTCWRCEFNEDFNQCTQLNQTLCNTTIARGECPDSVSILSCVEITETSAAGPIYVQVTPFNKPRPACYIRKGDLRLQPVFDSQIYFLEPKLESCNFVIARQIPEQYLQMPNPKPSTTA